MRTLRGISRHPGVAMALAVVVDAQRGLSVVPERVIHQGLRALRKGLADADLPDVIVVCDLLALGSAVRVPGVRTAGIAAENDDQPAGALDVPCVAGIADLLRSAGAEEIVIVDGDEGAVYLDPDVQTVVRYQDALAPKPAGRVFLESAHLPARTQDGRIVTVLAAVSSVSEAEAAISQGADALVVRFAELVQEEMKLRGDGLLDPHVEALQTVVALAGGKPLVVALAEPDERLAEAARCLGEYGHISFAGAADEPLEEADVRAAISSGAQQVTVVPDAVARTKDLIRTLPEEEANASDSHAEVEGTDLDSSSPGSR